MTTAAVIITAVPVTACTVMAASLILGRCRARAARKGFPAVTVTFIADASRAVAALEAMRDRLAETIAGLPVDGEPLDDGEMAAFTGCGMASLAHRTGLADLDWACGPCLDRDCTRCDGKALASGPCRCGHSAIAPRIGGGW